MSKNTAKKVKVISAKNSAVILHVLGSKGDAFRRAVKLADGTGYQLTQDNKGLTYKGATIPLNDKGELGKMDKQARLELGAYIAGKGSPVSVKVLSEAQAKTLASHPVTIERNGHNVSLRVTKLDAQYSASIEVFPKSGVVHYFQWESKKLQNRNKLHFGKLVKSS